MENLITRLKQTSPTVLLAAILVLAVALRLGILLAFPSVFAFDQTGQVQGSDAYDFYAQNLLKTGIYGHTANVPDAVIPPLYGYALAGVYGLIGRGYMQVALFHILLDVLSILMLYHITIRLLAATGNGPALGLLAALFYACYPYLIFQNLTLIDTPIFMTLLYAFLLLVILLRERSDHPAQVDRLKWLLACLAGIALGLCILARPVAAPLALFVALWYLVRLPLIESVRRLLPVAIFSVLVITPWIIRNYHVFNAFVPVSTNAGMNFWFGNSEYTIPFFRAGYHTQWAKTPKITLDERSSEALSFDLSMAYLRSNPGKIPELLWLKFLAYWSINVFPTQNPVEGTSLTVDANGVVTVAQSDQTGLQMNGLPKNDPASAYSQPLFDRVGRLVHILYFGTLLLLAIIGIALSAKYWQEVSLLWFTQLCMTLVYVIFVPATRYRVPTDPLLFIFSAYTLVAAWSYLQARSQRKSAVRGEMKPAA